MKNYSHWLYLGAVSLAGIAACNSGAEPSQTAPGQEPAVLQSMQTTDIPPQASNIEAAWTLEADYEQLDAVNTTGRIKSFIALPDQRRLDYEVSHIEGTPPRVLRGQLYESEQAHSGLTLTRRDTRLAGSFRVGQDEYYIQSLADGRLLLLLRDDSEPPPHGQPLVPENN